MQNFLKTFLYFSKFSQLSFQTFSNKLSNRIKFRAKKNPLIPGACALWRHTRTWPRRPCSSTTVTSSTVTSLPASLWRRRRWPFWLERRENWSFRNFSCWPAGTLKIIFVQFYQNAWAKLRFEVANYFYLCFKLLTKNKIFV